VLEYLKGLMKFSENMGSRLTSMTKRSTGIRITLKKVSDIAVLSLVVFFLLSLSFHNHALCFDNSSVKKISQSESTFPNESKEFCSACSLYGNIKLHNVAKIFDSSFLGIALVYLKPDVLLPSSFLTSKKSPRSPPVIL
jgi:hypothetical protein